MAEETTAPVEQTQKPVADEVKKKPDVVTYETHRKLLDEKKNIQQRLMEAEAKLDDFQKSVEAKQTKELEEQNRYRELYESIKGENENLKTTIEKRDEMMQDALKIDAFNKSLGDKKIDSKYSGFINTKNIIIDPATGSVDELTAQREVERVLSEYPEIVRSSTAAKPLPTQAPVGVSSVRKPSMQDRLELLARHLESKRR